MKKKKKVIKIKDPNAKAMWGKVKSVTYKDKTKYTRKKKHQNKEY